MKPRAVAAATVALLSSPVLSFSATRSRISSGSSSSSSTNRPRRQRFSLNAALAADQNDSSSLEQQRQTQAGWHRNVLKNVFRTNGNTSKKSPLKLNQSTAAASLLGDVATSSEVPTDFLLRNFERQTPLSLFGTSAAPNTVDLASFSPSEIPMLELQADDDDTSSVDRSPWLTRITSSVAEKTITGLIDRLTNKEHSNLSVKCDPNGSALDLFRGHFRSDASVEFGEIAFNKCLRMSGGRLEAQRLAINLFSRRKQQQSSKEAEQKRRKTPRWLNQFDFVAHNVLFTQDDLFESGCVRNGLRRLLSRILKKHISISNVCISSIKILGNGKIAIRGDASSFGLTPVEFEVRSAIGTSSRGHVVTFPGLEIALGPTLGMFVPVLPEVSLDLGHNAQILSVETTTSSGKPTLRVSARATITPLHTLKLHKKYKQPNKSYAAPFSVDVGRWLTSTGNFAH